MTETGRLILSYLLAQDNTSISSRHLADLCNLSLSTIRNEINWLNEALLPYGVHIDARQSQGCRLIIDDKHSETTSFKQLKYELRRKLFNTKSKTYRSDYIVRRLLISNNYITQDKLAEELFFSPSTVTRSVALAQQSLKRYGLEIKLKKNHGFYIVGDEFNKRVQMLIQHKKFMHLDSVNKSQEKRYSDYFLTQTEIYHHIRKTLILIFSKYEYLEFSFINIPKLANYLILSKQRHTHTDSMQLTVQQLEIIHSEPAYQASKEAFKTLSSFYDFTPSEKDVCSFARLMLGYRSLSSLNQIPEFKRNKIREEGLSILHELIQLENLDPSIFTSEFRDQFVCNIASMRMREIMNTPYDMESFYPFYGVSGISADFCCTLSKILENRFKMTFDQTYTKSNLYLFDRIFDQADKSSISLHILVISLYGIEHARNVAGYLRRKYHRYITSIHAEEFSRTAADDFKNVDLVMTDLSASHLSGNNIISVDFSNGASLCSDFEEYLRTKVMENMNEQLGNSIHKTKFKSKKEVFEFIAKTYQNENVSKEELFVDLMKRDECYSSVRKNSLAFISTYSLTLPQSTLMISINNTEIDWNGTKVKYLFFYYRNRAEQNDVYTFSRMLKNLLDKTPAELEEQFQNTEQLVAALAPKRFI